MPANRAVSQLRIRQVKMNDSGEYLCLAENSAGKANKTILLTVQVTRINYSTTQSSDWVLHRMLLAEFLTWRFLTTPAGLPTFHGRLHMMGDHQSLPITSATNHIKVGNHFTNHFCLLKCWFLFKNLKPLSNFLRLQ